MQMPLNIVRKSSE